MSSPRNKLEWAAFRRLFIASAVCASARNVQPAEGISMSSSMMVRESWRIAAVLARIAGAENTTAPSPVVRLDPGLGHGAFLHLKALQEIAVANCGNRAAGTPGYDRSAEYVAERLKEAGYVVRFEEFEFPFFEDRTPPVLVAQEPDGCQEAASAGTVLTLTNSGSGDVTGRLRPVNLQRQRLGRGARSGAAVGAGTGPGPCSLRLLGCGGAWPRRLAPPCCGAVRGGAPGHSALHQSRHGRFAQLRALRSRFRRHWRGAGGHGATPIPR
jgi:hypothetical protein